MTSGHAGARDSERAALVRAQLRVMDLTCLTCVRGSGRWREGYVYRCPEVRDFVEYSTPACTKHLSHDAVHTENS